MPTVVTGHPPTTQAAAPILVEMRRGAMVESLHRGVVAVVDADDGLVAGLGDVDTLVYPRSAIKPLQALPLIESGAADACAASPEELALACASHGGEPRHVAIVGGWLTRLGLGVEALACGAHAPNHEPAAEALIRAGQAPTSLHNNCSGKHAGVLATCVYLREPIQGYLAAEHPAQRRLLAAVGEMCGVSLAEAPHGIDGCGFPQRGIPLRALARGLARFAAPARLPPARAAACRRLAAAMAAYPELVSRSGHFVAQAITAARGKIVVKSGAEGVYVAAIPSRGLGVALKIEDGAGRAAQAAMAHLLIAHAALAEDERAAMAALARPPVTNVVGRIVGAIAPTSGW